MLGITLKLKFDTSNIYLVKGGNTKITSLGVIKQLVSVRPVNSLTNRYRMKSALGTKTTIHQVSNKPSSIKRPGFACIQELLRVVTIVFIYFLNFGSLFITQIFWANEVKFCFISIIVVNSPGYLFRTTINQQIFKVLNFVFVRPDYCSIGGAVPKVRRNFLNDRWSRAIVLN